MEIPQNMFTCSFPTVIKKKQPGQGREHRTDSGGVPWPGQGQPHWRRSIATRRRTLESVVTEQRLSMQQQRPFNVQSALDLQVQKCPSCRTTSTYTYQEQTFTPAWRSGDDPIIRWCDNGDGDFLTRNQLGGK
ncbi:hypothetical protein ElyMa_002815400 [Elysia marginata]|uniref:Uncharacterized protein n=1 Tax=Elysia marginata TaxID=1093978 RepID=A0AAV4HQN9_9GAST|nr:hypothetical protein ElyMa_002815400 [Elysia marginata]